MLDSADLICSKSISMICFPLGLSHFSLTLHINEKIKANDDDDYEEESLCFDWIRIYIIHLNSNCETIVRNSHWNLDCCSFESSKCSLSQLVLYDIRDKRCSLALCVCACDSVCPR